MPSVAQVVAHTLARLGARQAFAVVGSGNFTVTAALESEGVHVVTARQETGAVSMADGWTRTLTGTGLASVHQGPGLTNAITGLTEAAKGRTPMVLLAGEAPATAFGSNFRVDQEALALAAGAIPERVHGPKTAAADASRAMYRARAERRPVVLMLPIDVQQMECDVAPEPVERVPLNQPAPADAAIESVVELIERAERPVVLAGHGAVLAGARQPLVELGARIGAVLATSAVANGFFRGDPSDIGISGGFASPIAQELLAQADLVLAFGATLNRWTTRNAAHFANGAKVVQVDVDGSAIGRQHHADIGVVGDAASAARALVAALDERRLTRAGFRPRELAPRIRAEQWRNVPFEDHSPDGYIDPRTLSIALEDHLPLERTLAVDSGHFMGYPSMYLTAPDPAGFTFTQGFQSIGLGLPSAIGAAIARPDRICVAALGDGGAMMSLGELETAARLKLRMLIVIYNDAAYGAEVHHFGPLGHPLGLVRFPDTDFAALARAVGAEGITVRDANDLAPVSSWLEHGSGPLLLDAKVDPAVRAEWLEEAFREA